MGNKTFFTAIVAVQACSLYSRAGLSCFRTDTAACVPPSQTGSVSLQFFRSVMAIV